MLVILWISSPSVVSFTLHDLFLSTGVFCSVKGLPIIPLIEEYTSMISSVPLSLARSSCLQNFIQSLNAIWS